MNPTTFKIGTWIGYIGCAYFAYLWVFIQTNLWYVTVHLRGRYPWTEARCMFAFVSRSPISFYLYGVLLTYIPIVGWYVYNRTVFPWPMLAVPIMFQAYIWAYQANPPAVLFLSTSRHEAFNLRYRLERGLHPYRVVVLIDPSLADPSVYSLFQREYFEWDNLWVKKTRNWQVAAHQLMEMASFIVIDTRVATPSVTEEASRVLNLGLLHKTLFVVEANGNAPVLRANGISSTAPGIQAVQESQVIPLLKTMGLTKVASPDDLRAKLDASRH